MKHREYPNDRSVVVRPLRQIRRNAQQVSLCPVTQVLLAATVQSWEMPKRQREYSNRRNFINGFALNSSVDRLAMTMVLKHRLLSQLLSVWLQMIAAKAATNSSRYMPAAATCMRCQPDRNRQLEVTSTYRSGKENEQHTHLAHLATVSAAHDRVRRLMENFQTDPANG